MRRSLLCCLLVLGCKPAPSPEPAAPAVAPTPAPTPPPTPTPTPAPNALVVAEATAVRFAALKNGDATVEGTFSGVQGGLVLDPSRLSSARGALQVDLGRIDTGLPPRDLNIAQAFFQAATGTVRVDGLSFPSDSIDVGAALDGKVELSVDLGLGAVSAIVQVRLERPTDAALRFTLIEPLTVSIAGLGMEGRKAELITLCQHQSIGDEVTLAGAVTLALQP